MLSHDLRQLVALTNIDGFFFLAVEVLSPYVIALEFDKHLFIVRPASSVNFHMLDRDPGGNVLQDFIGQQEAVLALGLDDEVIECVRPQLAHDLKTVGLGTL